MSGSCWPSGAFLRSSTLGIYWWVPSLTPLLVEAARPCRHSVGDRWCVNDTYVKVADMWRYLYRAIDQFGQVVDLWLSPGRHALAARRFYADAMKATGTEPTQVITDRARIYETVLEGACPLRSTTWTGTPIMPWGPITVG
jgi:transposase, IS6 family